MSFTYTWVTSDGGPLMLMSKESLRYWDGCNSSSDKFQVEGHTDYPETDYDRACGIEDWIGLIQVGKEDALVLGGDDLSTTWISLPDTRGGILVRWVCANNEDAVLAAINCLREEEYSRTDILFTAHSERIVLFAACEAGNDDIYERLEIKILPGSYEILTAITTPDESTSLVLHQLREKNKLTVNEEEKVSMQEILTGTVKGPGENPHEFTFITTDNVRTRIGEYVYYHAQSGDAEISAGESELQIIGTIIERRLVRNLPDSFLADPNTPPALVSSLIGLADEGAEIYEIVVETIGFFSEAMGDFINPRIPPMPGQPVFLTSNEMLARMLSPRQKGEYGGAHIGSLLTREREAVPIILSVREIVSTHLAVLASTGAGKSYTASVLIEELLMPHNRAPVLIVDPHGEYHTLREIHNHPTFTEGSYKPEVKIYTPDKIRVRLSTLTENDLMYLLPEMTEKMRTFLSTAYRALINDKTRANGMWGFHDLLNEVLALKYEDAKGQGGGNVSTIDGLEWRLKRRFEQSKVFSDHEHIPLQDLFRPGQCTVLQLSDIDENEQQVIVGALLRRANKARVAYVRGMTKESDETVPFPVFVLLEEAHRYAPAGVKVVSTDILKQILSEGRKFGVGIGLITQRPGKLDQDVLSQCMTQFIMRIVNPIDQQTIASSVEGAGRRLLDELPALTKGQVIVSGVAVNTPVLCQVRKRITRHGGETIDAPTEWQKYFSTQATAQRERDEALYIKPKKKEETLEGFTI